MVIVFAAGVGLLLWSGFAPLEFALGPLLGLILFFRILSKATLKLRLVLAFVSGLALFLPLLHWSSTYVGSIPWLILAVGQSLFFGLLGFVQLERRIESAILFAASMTAIEILRMKLPFGGFGWGRIGHTQVEVLSAIYPIVGISGITFLLSLLAAMIALSSLKPILLLAAILLPFSLLPSEKPTGSINVLAVQGGVDKLGFEFNDRALVVLQRHAKLTEKAISPIDLVIWPENSADVDPIRNQQARDLVTAAAQRAGSKLLVGAVLQADSGPENASVLYNSTGEILSTYIKQDLAPFGEYIPIRTISEFVASEAAQVRDFHPGVEWVLHRVAGADFVSLICFEILDDDFVRSGVKEAQFVVAQTNNATFGRSAQAAQQLQITRARAAELGKDFAVVSTTGFTAYVTRDGSLASKLEQFKPGTLAMTLGVYQGRTWAWYLGSWFWVGLFLAATSYRYRSVFTR